MSMAAKLPPLFGGRVSRHRYGKLVDGWTTFASVEPEKWGLKSRLSGDALMHRELRSTRLRQLVEGVNYFKNTQAERPDRNYECVSSQTLQFFQPSEKQQRVFMFMPKFESLLRRPKGNKGDKPPCTFFAQGKCTRGDKCKFSRASTGGKTAQGRMECFDASDFANTAVSPSKGSSAAAAIRCAKRSNFELASAPCRVQNLPGIDTFSSSVLNRKSAEKYTRRIEDFNKNSTGRNSQKKGRHRIARAQSYVSAASSIKSERHISRPMSTRRTAIRITQSSALGKRTPRKAIPNVKPSFEQDTKAYCGRQTARCARAIGCLVKGDQTRRPS